MHQVSASIKQRKIKAALYTLMWVLLLFLALSELGGVDYKTAFLCSIFFLVNYAILIDRFFLKRKFIGYTLTNFLIFVLLNFIYYYLNQGTSSYFIFLLLVSLGQSLAIKLIINWLKYEIERINKENQFYKTELSMLKYQIQPHFFFNSLNNIYSLIDISPEKAKETVYGLGKLMRYLLYQTSDEKIYLEKEIQFLNNFINLMKIRLNKEVKITANFPYNISGIKVAPFLFVPLLENAFKHGVSSSMASEIFIDMRIENQQLMFLVQNTYFPKGEEDKSGSGVGLENLRTRLLLIYPNKHSFIQDRSNNYFTSTLKIDL